MLQVSVFEVNLFLSTPSARRATSASRSMACSSVFLSTPSARRATCGCLDNEYRWKKFLSTPSARRATQTVSDGGNVLFDFYPRPPRGGRQVRNLRDQGVLSISIHALREEGDPFSRKSRPPPSNDFYPRPPRGGRHCRVACAYGVNGDFYPRPPRGGRPSITRRASAICGFLSTPSARRATEFKAPITPPTKISIHALREEGDRAGRRHGQGLRNFYPRPPRGGRRLGPPPYPAGRLISIHALREEGDLKDLQLLFLSKVFLSTPSARRATATVILLCNGAKNFYPRPPRGGRRSRRGRSLLRL